MPQETVRMVERYCLHQRAESCLLRDFVTLRNGWIDFIELTCRTAVFRSLPVYLYGLAGVMEPDVAHHTLR